MRTVISVLSGVAYTDQRTSPLSSPSGLFFGLFGGGFCDRCVFTRSLFTTSPHTARHTRFHITISPHTTHTHVTRPQATSADYTAVHRRQPARLRPTTPRRCGSCAAALVTRRRSPARWSAHAPAATACKRPRARSVVRTPERHSERAMGAALTRPTGITSAPAGARAYGV